LSDDPLQLELNGGRFKLSIASLESRVVAAQFAHGRGGFALHGPESKGAAVLYLKEEGSLTFHGSDGEVTARLP
jgi:hypothetical protein